MWVVRAKIVKARTGWEREGEREGCDVKWTRERQGRKEEKKKTMGHEYNVPKVFKSTTNPHNILEEEGWNRD